MGGKHGSRLCDQLDFGPLVPRPMAQRLGKQMAVGVFAFRVTEPTCKNLGGAPGNKRVVTAHKGFRALRTGSRRAKVEISAQLLSLAISGDTATARIYERTTFQWIAPNLPVPASAQAIRNREPDRYALSPTGSRGETTSSFGIRHEVTLVKAASGWRLLTDAFDEFPIYLASPDLIPGSWAEVQRGGPKPGSLAAMATQGERI